nr:L-histidine N(alpha)-methyltransferase [Allopusillimonas ginsengisoli]
MKAGLLARPRHVSPKYFYDAAGSELFDRICALPEYYPMRTELGILKQHAVEMADMMGSDIDLVEFGAGSMLKVRLLLDAFPRQACSCRYVPIDISGDHLHAAAEQLTADFPSLPVYPVVADYTALTTLPGLGSAMRRRAGFFPGSTIGNMSPVEALGFLTQAAGLLNGGGLLIGVDLVKDPTLLHAAYNDAQGVTAAFNLNLLKRANQELGADFDLDGFAHHALYHPTYHRVEMHLVSKQKQCVTLAGIRHTFDEGESIHTENSHKYTVDGFRELAARAGFSPEAVWVDDDHMFSVHWLSAH